MSERGNLETIPMSEEYRKALSVTCDKIKEFKKQLGDSPQLVKLFNEVLDADDLEDTIHVYDVYKEAFAFGFALGQEVFDK